MLVKALRNPFLKPVVFASIGGVLASVCGWTLPDLQSLNIIGSTTVGLALFSTVLVLVLAAQAFKLDAQADFGILLSNVVHPLIALARQPASRAEG
ncbi:hypothetical protein FVF58_43595 [Paraburkholderia panacisoli]|uniref:Uncharacterized protein n=1 Tax=Paraburkholderia panacisoli TaxID=2603818 RepID=A0A5B0G5M6_9BURK|nr:hypothetical protein [Paraburkholderia panacisoli]KAA0998727.1 hypothetical protein FVF58_43595 [Paraburkholderia panacisoli]